MKHHGRNGHAARDPFEPGFMADARRREEAAREQMSGRGTQASDTRHTYTPLREGVSGVSGVSPVGVFKRGSSDIALAQLREMGVPARIVSRG